MPLPLYMAFRAPSGLRKRGCIGLDTSPCPRSRRPSFIEPLCVELPFWRFFRKSGKMPLPLYMAFRAPSGLRKRGRIGLDTSPCPRGHRPSLFELLSVELPSWRFVEKAARCRFHYTWLFEPLRVSANEAVLDWTRPRVHEAGGRALSSPFV